MRFIVAILLGTIVVCGTCGQGANLKSRYNLDYNPNNFPQATPQEALASALKAIADQRIDYLLAHLTDPTFVDDRVRTVHKGKFEELVREVKTKLSNDPEGIKTLQRFARAGEWDIADAAASAKLKDVKDRLYYRKVAERWFLENDKKKVEKNDK